MTPSAERIHSRGTGRRASVQCFLSSVSPAVKALLLAACVEKGYISRVRVVPVPVEVPYIYLLHIDQEEGKQSNRDY